MRITVFLFAAVVICTTCCAQINPRDQLQVNPGLKIKFDTTPIRFAFTVRDAVTNTSPGAMPLHKWYNHNESFVNASPNAITINKSGLYHFDCFLRAAAISNNTPTISLYLSGVIPSSSLLLVKDEAIPASPTSGIYRRNWDFSFDIYIKAPATLQLMRQVIGSSSSTGVEGSLLGRFVND